MADTIMPVNPSVPPVTHKSNDPGARKTEPKSVKHAVREDRSTPFIERRKNPDRRKNKHDARPVYDMRSGKDRRKNHGNAPSIDINA